MTKIFSKAKCIAWYRKYKTPENKIGEYMDWINECDGKEPVNGNIEGYGIFNDWCEVADG